MKYNNVLIYILKIFLYDFKYLFFDTIHEIFIRKFRKKKFRKKIFRKKKN